MANREKNQTKEEREAQKEIEIPRFYDYDVFKGSEFLKTLPEILCKRYVDGWEFVRVFRLGEDPGKIPIKTIYGVLYKNINSLSILSDHLDSIVISEAKNRKKDKKNESEPSKKD